MNMKKNVTFMCEVKETINLLGIPYNSLRLSTSGWKKKITLCGFMIISRLYTII